jgi:hypothetical protein
MIPAADVFGHPSMRRFATKFQAFVLLRPVDLTPLGGFTFKDAQNAFLASAILELYGEKGTTLGECLEALQSAVRELELAQLRLDLTSVTIRE